MKTLIKHLEQAIEDKVEYEWEKHHWSVMSEAKKDTAIQCEYKKLTEKVVG